MATAKRRKTQRVDEDDFGIPIADALAQLLPARHITPGATWWFKQEGDQLIITRSVPIVSIPDPDS